MARLIDKDEAILALEMMEKYDDGYILADHQEILERLREIEYPEQKWISVKEELPKKQRDYLCVCQFGDDPSWRWPLVLMFYPDKNDDNGYVKGPHFADEGLNDMRVAYWMPIQKWPKEEK